MDEKQEWRVDIVPTIHLAERLNDITYAGGSIYKIERTEARLENSGRNQLLEHMLIVSWRGL